MKYPTVEALNQALLVANLTRQEELLVRGFHQAQLSDHIPSCFSLDLLKTTVHISRVDNGRKVRVFSGKVKNVLCFLEGFMCCINCYLA